jgi:dTDP-4-amino-4,6-dideoxygalactose transaminase
MTQQTANRIQVKFSYLQRQFADIEPYLQDVKALVQSGDLTLGRALEEFEGRFARLVGVPHAVGVGSGTDALALSLRALGVGPGDEVITSATSFIATVGAIVMAGAKPVLVDSEDGFVIDAAAIEAAITPRTRAIIPVHYTGNVADLPAVLSIARKHKLAVVEDACQAIGSSLEGRAAGSWGDAGCFSLHPLKNINVWGDGGLVTTHSAELAAKLRLLRNHGLASRDEAVTFGWNSRLDTLQAVIGNRLLGEVESIVGTRIAIAARYDEAFSALSGSVCVPRRRPGVRHSFHLYVLRARGRDELLVHLNRQGVEAKVHYPIPLHLQQAASPLGYKEGDFPVSEEDCRCIITLPAHQHLRPEEVEHVIAQVEAFYEEL